MAKNFALVIVVLALVVSSQALAQTSEYEQKSSGPAPVCAAEDGKPSKLETGVTIGLAAGTIAAGITNRPGAIYGASAASYGWTTILVNRDVSRTIRYSECVRAQVALEAEYQRAGVERLRVEKNAEIENNRTAADVFRTAAETGASGTVVVQNGTIVTSVTKNQVTVVRNTMGPS